MRLMCYVFHVVDTNKRFSDKSYKYAQVRSVVGRRKFVFLIMEVELN